MVGRDNPLPWDVKQLGSLNRDDVGPFDQGTRGSAIKKPPAEAGGLIVPRENS